MQVKIELKRDAGYQKPREYQMGEMLHGTFAIGLDDGQLLYRGCDVDDVGSVEVVGENDAYDLFDGENAESLVRDFADGEYFEIRKA